MKTKRTTEARVVVSVETISELRSKLRQFRSLVGAEPFVYVTAKTLTDVEDDLVFLDGGLARVVSMNKTTVGCDVGGECFEMSVSDNAADAEFILSTVAL